MISQEYEHNEADWVISYCVVVPTASAEGNNKKRKLNI